MTSEKKEKVNFLGEFLFVDSDSVDTEKGCCNYEGCIFTNRPTGNWKYQYHWKE